MRRLLLALAPLSLILTSCDNSPQPPGDEGVCYHYAIDAHGKGKFNVLSRNAPNLETCAASLEGMRQRFLALGGNRSEIIGAYQSKFLFVGPEGVFVGDTLEGARFPALVPTGDGRLAVPGALPPQQ